MKRKMFFLISLFMIVIGCEKEFVPDPILVVDYSASKVLYGDTLTINWRTVNASRIETNFCNSKNLEDSFFVSLTEDKIFHIEAFNEAGISIVKKFKVNVFTEYESILITHKWQEVELELYDNGNWTPYNSAGKIREFKPDYSLVVYDKEGKSIGSGPGYNWSISGDDLIMVNRPSKIILISKTEMILEQFVTGSTFRTKLRALTRVVPQ